MSSDLCARQGIMEVGGAKITTTTEESTCSTGTAQPLAPICAEVDRLERITVCTRPFRAAGPRIEAERLGGKLLIHNYGHGGSGWSLSWGSAAEVVELARTGLQREVAVIGCGALGLTAAIALQRVGARVTIYARELPPHTRSSRATGSWTPDSRVALASAVDGAFASRWERMARTSFAEFQGHLQAPGDPIRLQPKYVLSALPPGEALLKKISDDPIGFAYLEHRTSDLWPECVDLSPEQSPFSGLYARQVQLFRFDIARYSELLMTEFRQRGGVLKVRSFDSATELAQLPQLTIVNCTGFGAKALFGDESVIPVRGQIGWLPAQEEVRYSLQWESLNVVSRPDGLVVQLGAGGDPAGWQDSSEETDLRESQDAVRMLAALQAKRRAAQFAGT